MAKIEDKKAPVSKKSQFENSLQAEKREIFGRKIKKLRKNGIIPANVSGKHIKSFSIQVKADEFKKVFSEAGETGVVGLTVDGAVHPVLIHEIHKDPVYDSALHVDFLEVNLSEKVTATVPVEIVGESPAVASETGVLVTQMHEVEVEALPTDLPDSIQVDISGLTAVDDAIKVSDLKVDRSKVEIKEEDPERIVVSIAEPAKEEVEEVAPSAAEGEEGAPAEGETGEGETPAEGAEEKPVEEKNQE
ncbi:MAG: 50S ribosomal protein L25 [Candidatus Blackburnbacteria bacterium]|nr:50S ribosomal protein L25 [Candidatus Blackburnbacteria bacterium]